MKLSFEIKKPSTIVFDYLTDMQKFVSVHPVIKKIEEKGDSKYLVHETLKFAGIPISFTYSVLIENYPEEHKVIMRATVMKLTKVDMTFILKPGEVFTLVEEEILLRSPLPVKSMVLNIFKKQHEQLFKNMEMGKD